MRSKYLDGRYFRIWNPSHHRASHGYVYEHILAAEEKIGRPLSQLEEVHHLDGNKQNNSVENLHVCKDHAEHMALERAQVALAACGHSDWMKCGYCGKFDAPSNLYIYTPKGRNPRGHHLLCRTKYNKTRWATSRKK